MILILISKLNNSIINIAIIDINIYCRSNKSKAAYNFAIFMKDLKFQVVKKAKPETNSKNVVFKKYYDFLSIFQKKFTYTSVLLKIGS